MTRPKVDPDKRQRTAQACDSCKRRKQKCNGRCPCNTCERRSLSCTYGATDHTSADDSPPPKRQLTESGIAWVGAGVAPAHHGLSPPPSLPTDTPRHGHSSPQGEKPVKPELNSLRPNLSDPLISNPSAPPKIEGGLPIGESRGTTQSENDEEAVVYTQARMLQDPTGRLLYVGDSGTLSFLQLVRMTVESVVGPSPFTLDPRRHRILENVMSLPPNVRHTHLLPDKKTAQVLIESFFVNTHGLVQVFDRATFLTNVDNCYSDPLSTDPSFLCLLNLVFAIGLVLAMPTPGSFEAKVVDKLRADPLDRAEIFYRNAKNLSDPVSGFEDADFWSIQALLLMAIYMLAVSKRNAAFAYFGMAVRSAFALGLHREETLVIWNQHEQQERRNLWRSLYVIDRFLSASLGRPTAISDDDCSGDTLKPADTPPSSIPADPNQYNSLGLEASVRICNVIGIILKRVYQQRKVSTRLAGEIADLCKIWPKALSPSLHWRQATAANPSQGIAILHVNIFYCHSIILLNRPFFLFLFHVEIQKFKSGQGRRTQRSGRMEKFAEACVIASTHTVALVQNAYEGGYLPKRNPFVIYFLFAAALIILCNEFGGLYFNPDGDACISNSITLMAYCAETDPQASRLLTILSTFQNVVIARKGANSTRLTSQALDKNSNALNQSNIQSSPLDTQNQNPPLMRPETAFNQVSPTAVMTSPSQPQTQGGPQAPLLRQTSATFGLPDLGINRGSNQGQATSDDSAGPDEQVEFDALWQWPATMTGSATVPGSEPMIGAGVQGISDSSVPLFGNWELSGQWT